MDFETEFGDRVVIDRVVGRLRICYFNDPDDPTDCEVIMFNEEQENELRSMLGGGGVPDV